MKYRTHHESGFTAVELLVTLFVAAAFVVAGYQLFNVIIRDGGDTRAQSVAANVAYSYLRQYSDSATNPCSPLTPLTNESVPVDGLTDTVINVSIECTQPDTPSLSKVNVTIAYNKDTPKKTLSYSTYVDKSRGASTSRDITAGLVGWWPFNGNANSNVGSVHATVVGATTTAGQNSAPNGAYGFTSPCCRHISVPDSMPPLAAAATFSAWIRPTATPAERANIITSTPFNGTSGFYFSMNSDRSVQTYWYGASSPGYHSSGASTIPLNQWTHVAATWGSGTVRIYTNGTLRTTVSSTAPTLNSYGVAIGAQTFDNSRQFVGSIDDARVYNRALSASEVLQLFQGGAK